MKHFTYNALGLMVITVLSVTPNAKGAEIEGVHFENTYETQGIRMKIQGAGLLRYLGFIKGADFASALFSMWLGEFPMNESFKKQLLGLK